MDCIELSFFLTLFKPVFDFADTCKCTDLLVFAASTANIAHNCVEYLLRFYTQGCMQYSMSQILQNSATFL